MFRNYKHRLTLDPKLHKEGNYSLIDFIDRELEKLSKIVKSLGVIDIVSSCKRFGLLFG